MLFCLSLLLAVTTIVLQVLNDIGISIPWMPYLTGVGTVISIIADHHFSAPFEKIIEEVDWKEGGSRRYTYTILARKHRKGGRPSARCFVKKDNSWAEGGPTPMVNRIGDVAIECNGEPFPECKIRIT